MGGSGTRPLLRVVEVFLRHPDGITIYQLADELGLTRDGANARLQSIYVEGFVECVRTGVRGSPAIYRLGPRIRSAAMDAGERWRSEIVGKPSEQGAPAFPRERRE